MKKVDDEVRQIIVIMEKQHSMLRAAKAIRDLMKEGERGKEEQNEEWIRLQEALANAQGYDDWHGSAGTLALSRAKWGSMKPENAVASPVAAVDSSRRDGCQPPDSGGPTDKSPADPFMSALKFLRRRHWKD